MSDRHVARRPLSRAYRPFTSPILKGRSGSNPGEPTAPSWRAKSKTGPLALEPAPERRTADLRRPLHDDEAARSRWPTTRSAAMTAMYSSV